MEGTLAVVFVVWFCNVWLQEDSISLYLGQAQSCSLKQVS